MRMPALLRLVCGTALACVAHATLAETPSRIQATYDLSANGFKIAIVNETYTRNGNHYHLESVSHAYGLAAVIKHETIRASSDGNLGPQGLRPTSYSHTREVDKEKNASAKFDWVQNTLTLNDRDGQRTQPLPARSQDRLSTMYQFQFLPINEMSEVRFSMVDGSKLEEYVYAVTPNKTAHVPLGPCTAYYLATQPQPDGWKSEVWLRTQDRVPCKVVLTDSNGDRYIQVLTALTVEP